MILRDMGRSWPSASPGESLECIPPSQPSGGTHKPTLTSWTSSLQDYKILRLSSLGYLVCVLCYGSPQKLIQRAGHNWKFISSGWLCGQYLSTPLGCKLVCLPFDPWPLPLCLQHNKDLISICQMYKWMVEVTFLNKIYNEIKSKFIEHLLCMI